MSAAGEKATTRAAWVLVGATATGKTAVANLLARRLGADVLSADSMLVYRGLDVGTAKPSAADCAGLVVHGMDVVPPDEAFSTGRWLQAARAAFASAAARGRGMIVAGGTGLYVNALLRGLDAPPADAEQRRRLVALLEAGGVAALQAEAETREPGVLATVSDPENPRRLIRLIEQQIAGGGEGRAPRAGVASTRQPVVGLSVEPVALASRIEARISKMFADGLLEEVAALRQAWPRFSETAGKGIGYAEAMAVLDGTLTREAAAARMAARTRRLAKRQRTWFRHQLDVVWVRGPDHARDVERAADEVMKQWREHGQTDVFI